MIADMTHTLRALSALLGYPSAALQENIPAVREALVAEAALPAEAIARLDVLLRSFESEELLDLQGDYSGLFDSSRSVSLHLFEHVHGDNRDRGQAMVDLGQQYIDAGFMMEAAELPDFIPLFLEFLSWLSTETAREWLGQPAHVFAVLEQRLRERDSAYAAVFHALVALAGKPSAEAIAEIEDHVDPQDPAALDQAWEDAPVNFGAPPQDGGGPTGIIARIRAARRPVAKRPVPQAEGTRHA